MTTNPSIAAIIPAFNEARRISIVLGVLQQVGRITEIIVVDDSSKDGTVEQVLTAQKQDHRIRLISHPKNLGKGQALMTGMASTNAPVILMVDADLINLSPEHIEALIQPVITGRAKMTMGIFRGGRWNTDLAHTVTPWMTGQRCFRAQLMRYVHPKAAAGYGIETALTIAAHRLGWKQCYIPWFGVTHPPGEVHRGFIRGLANRGKMYVHVVRALILALGFKRAVSFMKAWKLPV